MICLRNFTGVQRNVNDNDSYCFATFSRRFVSNKGVFFRFFPAITSELRLFLRGKIRRAFCLCVARATALVINFRLIRVQVIKRMAFRIFKATRYVRMYGCNIALSFAQVLRTRVVKINRRTRRFLLSFVDFFNRVGTITWQFARLNFSVDAKRTRTNYVVQWGSLQFCRNFSVSVVRATSGLSNLLSRKLLIFAGQCNYNARNDSINDLASKMDRRACQGANFGIARLSFYFRDKVALRTQCNSRVRVVRDRFTRFQGLKLSRSN